MCECDSISACNIDKKILRQILFIILSNSLKYTMAGNIGIYAANINGYLTITVSDTGIGIDEKVIKSIFDPFSNIESKSKNLETGTGINLYLVKKLVELMEGTVEISSTKNEFTKILITFPQAQYSNDNDDSSIIYPISGDNQPINTKIANTYEENPNKAQCKVLVAEDNPLNIFAIQSILSKLPCKTDICYNGQEAVEKAKNVCYDIILMDINMPILNGLEATKQIMKFSKENNRARPLIYAVTAQSESILQSTDSSIHFTAIISKPVSFKTISNIINEYTKKKQ